MIAMKKLWVQVFSVSSKKLKGENSFTVFVTLEKEQVMAWVYKDLSAYKKTVTKTFVNPSHQSEG